MRELLGSVAPGLGLLSSYPAQLAAQGPRRRAGADRAAGPAGHGLRRARRACRRSPGSTPRSSACVGYALFGPSQDPRARTGLVARAHDRRHDPPARRRRTGTRQRAVALASALALMVGAIMTVGRRRQARLRRRPDLQADDDRLHERAGGHDPRRPAAQALRLLGRRRRASSPRPPGSSEGLADGETVAAALAVGLLGLVLILVLQRLLPKVPACSSPSWSRSRGRRAFDLADHGVVARRPAAPGLPAVHRARASSLSDLALLVARRARHRARLARRHHLHRLVVRRPDRPGGRRATRR